MKRNLILLVCVVVVVAAVWYVVERPMPVAVSTQTVTSTSSTAQQTQSQTSDTTIQYRNDQYGFSFALPADWKGYSIVSENWTGYSNCSSGQCPAEQGPEILIRNPQWTSQHPWQDIPIMIFTHDQWTRITQEQFSVSAAPVPPSELGENTKYVFALPPRFDYAYPEGWQEVESIIAGHPLQTY